MSKLKVEGTKFYSKRSIRIGEKLFDLTRPQVMGIINCTPDSFYAESRKMDLLSVLQEVERKIHEGASIIDVGGYSSRPGAAAIHEAEEIKRIQPMIAAIRKNFPEIVLSIDTFRGATARVALEEGADLINDISGGNLDPSLFQVLAHYSCPYILMHTKGTPQNMQNLSVYNNLFQDICLFFSEKIRILRDLGVHDIILDPGFGFAKTREQNFELLKNLHAFDLFRLPLLAGVSRKSMVYKTLGIEADEALNGTTVLHTVALLEGASILRVHDVKEAVQAIHLVNKIQY